MRVRLSRPPEPTNGFHVDVAERDEDSPLLDQLTTAIRRAVPQATLTRQLPGRLCVYAVPVAPLAERTERWLRAKQVEVQVVRW